MFPNLFDNKKSLLIIDEFVDGLPNQDNLKIDSFLNLIKKFKDTNSSLRLSFRENMAFIIGLSDHFLMKSANKWEKFDCNKKRTIKYFNKISPAFNISNDSEKKKKVKIKYIFKSKTEILL